MAATSHSSSIITFMYDRQGATTSLDMQRELNLSQPTLSRSLAAMVREGKILRLGAARQSIYLLPAPDAGVAILVPIMRVDEAGDIQPFGQLTPLVGGRYCVEFNQGLNAVKHKIYGGLPWFLSDMRPQGFLGRLFSRKYPALTLDLNPLKWHDKDIVRALVSHGEDLPGNLLLGHQAFDQFLLMRGASPHGVAKSDYSAIAQSVLSGAPAGSSAGGEQPKFCATRVDGRAVIVKFSPLDDSPAASRWRDLSICEHIALTTLRENGLAAAVSTLHLDDRIYLEVERFDRTDNGRIGMVSLEAFDNEYIGQLDTWDRTAERALSRGLLNTTDARNLQCLEAFGRLIANTDRHYCNVSLIRQDSQWRLAPAYDMLPMFYAPVSGEVIDRQYDIATLQPTLDTLSVWPEALKLASLFWRRVRADKLISAEFQLRLANDWDAWLATRPL